MNDVLDARLVALSVMVDVAEARTSSTKRLREEMMVERVEVSSSDLKRAREIYARARKAERKLDALSPWYVTTVLMLPSSDGPVEPVVDPRPYEVEVAEIYQAYAEANELGGTRMRKHARYVADRLKILYLQGSAAHASR